MSLLSSRCIQPSKCLLNNIQKRFSVRQTIHKYVEPHKFKKHMLNAAEPYYKRKHELPSETCKGFNNKEVELHPLDRIYVDEILEEIRRNDFVLFLQHNYTPFQSERVYKNTLTKSGGIFLSHKNQVYKKVFEELKIDQVQHLFTTRNSIVVGQVDKLPACVRALKKMPQFILLAGCIDQDVITHDQLQQLAIMRNIDECRANLLATLETPSIDLAYYLEQHANNIEHQSQDDKTSE